MPTYSYDRQLPAARLASRLVNIFNARSPVARGPDGFYVKREWLPLRSLQPGQVFSEGGATIQRDVDSLVEAIRSGTRVKPLVARATKVAGRFIYSLRDGHHRVAALKQLGLTGEVLVDVWYEAEP
jgi:hypothetical protein